MYHIITVLANIDIYIKYNTLRYTQYAIASTYILRQNIMLIDKAFVKENVCV